MNIHDEEEFERQLQKEIKKYEELYKQKLKEIDDRFDYFSEFKTTKYKIGDKFIDKTYTIKVLSVAPHLDIDRKQQYFCQINSMGNIVYVTKSDDDLDNLEKINTDI